jgi:hypothetical protein
MMTRGSLLGRRRRPRSGLPALCLGLGCAPLVQPLGWNEVSHYAQVLAFSTGTAIIDPYAAGTGDKAVFHGHFYSDKAPGLSLLTLPVQLVVRAIGIDARTNATHVVHLLAIVGCLIPGALLLYMLSTFVERFEPGLGVPVALMLGLGSLLLPFSTVYFSHVLAASLGFGAYYLLWLERDRGAKAAFLLPAAGVLAGLAVTTEYPSAILALGLGVYAIRRRPILARGSMYAAGLLIGVAPLLAYDWWAFGSPTHISYSSVGLNQAGFFGLVGFHPGVALDLLFGDRGLIRLAPVLAVAAVGIVCLHRDGRRSEARAAGGIALAYLAYNACYYLPFGGESPGPRFLIPLIPFLALPLAAALRRLPVLTLALGVVSAAIMVTLTLTGPELPVLDGPGVWWHRLVRGEFTGSRPAVVWFAASVLIGVVLAIRGSTRGRISRSQLAVGAAGVAGWLLVARAGPGLLAGDLLSGDVALCLVVGTAAAIVFLMPRADARVLLSGLMLAAFALPAITEHHRRALLLGAAAFSLVTAAGLRRRKEYWAAPPSAV